MVFLIRPAAVSDAGALALIKQNVWQTAYKNIYPKQKIENFDLAAQTQYFARLAADGRVSLFVAEVQGKCVVTWPPAKRSAVRSGKTARYCF